MPAIPPFPAPFLPCFSTAIKLLAWVTRDRDLFIILHVLPVPCSCLGKKALCTLYPAPCTLHGELCALWAACTTLEAHPGPVSPLLSPPFPGATNNPSPQTSGRWLALLAEFYPPTPSPPRGQHPRLPSLAARRVPSDTKKMNAAHCCLAAVLTNNEGRLNLGRCMPRAACGPIAHHSSPVTGLSCRLSDHGDLGL